jgi:uncharacterized membrane protein (DUF4010 family)
MNATPNRRGLLFGALTAAAMASAAAIPAIADADRPIRSQVYKAAWARLLETEDRTNERSSPASRGARVSPA